MRLLIAFIAGVMLTAAVSTKHVFSVTKSVTTSGRINAMQSLILSEVCPQAEIEQGMTPGDCRVADLKQMCLTLAPDKMSIAADFEIDGTFQRVP